MWHTTAYRPGGRASLPLHAAAGRGDLQEVLRILQDRSVHVDGTTEVCDLKSLTVFSKVCFVYFSFLHKTSNP